MKSKTTLLIIIGIPFLLVLSFISFVSTLLMFLPNYQQKQYRDNLKKQTAETASTISDYTESRESFSKFPSTRRNYGYRYVINGKMYYSPTRTNAASPPYDRYRKGAQGIVCYEPSNPDNASFYFAEENHTCGQ